MAVRVYKSVIVIFILTITNSNLFSQCLCSEIKFSLTLPELEFKDSCTNYSIYSIKITPSSATDCDTLIRNWEKIERWHLQGDTLNLIFRTGGGIHILKFIVRNDNTKEEMGVTCTSIAYDTPYFINLTTFSKGNYLFDWVKISKCLREKPPQEIIECERMKFYQTQLKNISRSGNYITPWQIKPYSLIYFIDTLNIKL
jgi:hypothetical protein